jgi:DNA-binding response OmpR family regulator
MAKIAVISEDSETIQRYVSIHEQQGHETVSTEDVRASWAFVESEEPDLVTLEDSLADPMLRIGLVGFAGANAMVRKIPIVMCSDQDPEDLSSELRDLGKMNVTFLHRPVQEEAYLAVLQTLLDTGER